MSLYALNRLGLDQVWWLVSPQNPLKSKKGMAPLSVRLEGARALARHPAIIVTELEAALGTRYTIETLRALKARFRRTHFVWLMGSDNLRQMPKWREWPGIFGTVPVAVFRRTGYAGCENLGKAAQRFGRYRKPVEHASALVLMHPPAWMVLDNRLEKISATAIREEKRAWQKSKKHLK
jgi:nicotinate-nucleotide adenylyltransferase